MLPSIIIAICITVLVIIVAYGYHIAGLKANQENFLRKTLGLPHLSIYKSFLHESFLPQKLPTIIMVQALYIYLVPLHGNIHVSESWKAGISILYLGECKVLQYDLEALSLQQHKQ